MDFIYLSRVLLKRKWIIIGAAVLAALIAFLLTGNEAKKFRSTAQVSTGFTVSDEIKLNENFSFYEAETKFNNAIVTFKSPAVISLLSYGLLLHDLNSPSPFANLEKEQQTALYRSLDKEQAKSVLEHKLKSMTMLTSYKPEEKKLLEMLKLYGYDYKTLNDNLGVYRLERTDYIQIDYISENPELSAYVVNTLYEQFMRYYRSVRSSKSAESIDTLHNLMQKKKETVAALDAQLRANGVTIDDQNSSNLDLIAELEQKLADERTKNTQYRYDLQKVNQRIANLPSRTATPGGGGNDEVLIARNARNEAYRAHLNNKTDAALLARYNQLNEEYQAKLRASSSAAAENPPVAGESRLELQNKKNDIELDISASNASIGSLQRQINSLRGSVVSVASSSAAVKTLMDERDIANKEYQAALQKYNDATDMSSSSVNNFRQVLQGQPAIEPEPSKRKVIVALAGFAAMITSILIIVFLAYLDSSLKTPAIFARTVNLKLISMINFMNLKDKRLADIIAHKDANEDQSSVDKTRNNVFRESLRKLRYEIEMSGKKVFLFTSTKKGQGKTTLIQALSYSMSLSKKKILIIDTNFCNNDLTVQLNANPILEKITPDKRNGETLLKQIKSVSKDIGVGSVFAIGSEGGDYTPSEILPRENLLHHLQSLTTEFDYIFLEGPPLNDFSDSKELAQYVDGVIAVFSATNIIKQIDKQSITFFKELNGKFCGSILNMVDLKNVNVA